MRNFSTLYWKVNKIIGNGTYEIDNDNDSIIVGEFKTIQFIPAESTIYSVEAFIDVDNVDAIASKTINVIKNSVPELELLEPENEANDISSTSEITLSWSASDNDVNSYDDEITYNVYFDQNSDPQAQIAQDTTDTDIKNTNNTAFNTRINLLLESSSNR